MKDIELNGAVYGFSFDNDLIGKGNIFNDAWIYKMIPSFIK